MRAAKVLANLRRLVQTFIHLECNEYHNLESSSHISDSLRLRAGTVPLIAYALFVCLFLCFTPQSTAMVMSRRSVHKVHLPTLSPG